MTELEKLRAARDATLIACNAANADQAAAVNSASIARLAYSAARDASKAYNAILAAQDKEDKNV